MYLTHEQALAEITNLDTQIAEQEAALKNLRAKRAMLIEQTAPPRRSNASLTPEQRIERWEAILRLRTSGCSLNRIGQMLRCAAYQEINAAARFLSRPANANHPLQKLATEAGIGIPRPKPTATASEAAIDMPICDVEISTRLANVLLNQGARTIADAIAITEESLLDIPNFGNKCLNEFRALRAEFSAG